MADPVFKSVEPQDNIAERLGRTLQYEREKQGLSVRDAAQQLCLSTAIIRSLEAGDMANLPDLVYVRGYVRAYCKMLKMPPEPLLEGYVFDLSQHQDDDFPPPMDEHVHRLTRLWGSLAVFTVIALLVSMWWIDQSGEFGEPPSQPVLSPVSAPALSPDSPSTSPPSEASPDEEVSKSTSQPQQSQPVLDVDLITLTIHASDSSWAHIIDGSGEVIINRMLFAEHQKVVYGVFPFNLKFGDARNVRLWVNGEEYDVNRHISQLNTAFFTLEQPVQ